METKEKKSEKSKKSKSKKEETQKTAIEQSQMDQNASKPKKDEKKKAEKSEDKKEISKSETQVKPTDELSPQERIRVMNDHKISLTELYKKFNVDPNQGLTHEEAAERLKKYGINGIKREDADWPFWRKNLKEIIISSIFGCVFAYQGSPIFAIFIVLGSWLMFHYASKGNIYTEFAPEALVLRNGEWVESESGYIVPGDIVKLRTGEKICADMRLLECQDLEIEVKNLTGEDSSYKRELNFTNDQVIKSNNMVFGGGSVVQGEGKGLVLLTGEHTVHGVLTMKKREKNAKPSGKKEKTE